MKAERISLAEIAKIFFVIGSVGFGGWAVIISLMQDYFVNRKKLLSIEEFSHGIALGQFLGPFAVNSAIFVGYRLRDFLGGLVAVVSFLLPSVIVVTTISALYLKYHQIPYLQPVLKGINPVVIALILSAAYQMGKGKIKSFENYFLIILSVVLFLYFKIQIFTILILALFYGILKAKFILKEAE